MIARGIFLMVLSQGVFLLAGFTLNFGLARFLGPGKFGYYGWVMSILLVVEVFVITGIPELIQKFGGANPKAMRSLKQKTFKWQFLYSSIAAGLFILLSPIITEFFHKNELTTVLRIAGFDIIFYGLFRYYVGIQNGLHQFEKYSILGFVYSISKLIFIFILVSTKLSLLGAIIGNTMASITGLGVALVITKYPKDTSPLQKISYFSFILPNILYFVSLSALLYIDLWFVSYYWDPKIIGYYVSATALGKLPYFFSIAVSAALLPSISLALRQKDNDRVQMLVQQFSRYFLIFVFLVVLILGTSANSIIRLAFGYKYIPASKILPVVSFGLSMISVFCIFNTILIAKNFMKQVLLITIGIVLVDILFCRLLVPEYGMLGAGVSITVAAVIGISVSGRLIFLNGGYLVPKISFLRISGWALLLYLPFYYFQGNILWDLLKSFLLAICYLGLLWLTKEFTASDFQIIKDIFIHSASVKKVD